MARISLKRTRQAPAEETSAFGGVAERFRRAGDLDMAISLCREGLQRFPDLLSARVTLGWALLDKGEFEEAQVELQHVLRRAPDNLAAIRGLAELHDRVDSPGSMEGWQQPVETEAEPQPFQPAPEPPPPHAEAPALLSPAAAAIEAAELAIELLSEGEPLTPGAVDLRDPQVHNAASEPVIELVSPAAALFDTDEAVEAFTLAAEIPVLSDYDDDDPRLMAELEELAETEEASLESCAPAQAPLHILTLRPDPKPAQVAALERLQRAVESRKLRLQTQSVA